jgi:Ras GTPase-activating-like protein IQGAP2/3
MDQYLTLSKKDLKINITLNELYVTHEYLLKHIDDLVGPSLSALVLIFIFSLY